MYAACFFAQQDAAGGLIGGMLGLMLVFWLLAIAASIFWIWMLVDALTTEPTTNDNDHHSVQLPKPVTAEVAERFNTILGRSR